MSFSFESAQRHESPGVNLFDEEEEESPGS